MSLLYTQYVHGVEKIKIIEMHGKYKTLRLEIVAEGKVLEMSLFGDKNELPGFEYAHNYEEKNESQKV